MKTTQEYEDFAKEYWATRNDSHSPITHSINILKAWDEHQATQATQPEKEELIPFNLEEALQEPERVRFRNGKTPLEWHYFSSLNSLEHNIVAVNTQESIVRLDSKGSRFIETSVSEYDLMLVKKKRLVWFGLYEVQSGEVITTPTFDMKEKVKDFIGSRKLLKLYSYEL